MAIYTHDRIDLTAGLLAETGLGWGSNALQSIQINRNTPSDPQQAIGYLGVVDYTSGVIVSDVTLDCILTEQSFKAAANASSNLYAFAAKNLSTVDYVLTSFSLALAAGSPGTCSYGYMTNGIAEALVGKASPAVMNGEEAAFAVVMGDDGSGIELVPTWKAGSPAMVATTIPVITWDVNGAPQASTQADRGLPGGVQSLHFSGSINRDHVLDVRSASPIAFVTTYPLDITMSMDMLVPFYEAAKANGTATWKRYFDKLTTLAVAAPTPVYTKHAGALVNATAGDMYVKVMGLKPQSDTEGVSVGQHLSYTLNYTGTDLYLPLNPA